MWRGPYVASSSAERSLDSTCFAAAVVFTCAVVLCLVGVVSPSPRHTLSTHDYGYSCADAIANDAQFARVEDWHPSTACEENETLTDVSDRTLLAGPVTPLDYSSLMIISSPGGGGQDQCELARGLCESPPPIIRPVTTPFDDLSLTTSPPDAGTPEVPEVSMVVCSDADSAVSRVAKPVHPVVAAALWSRRQTRRCGSMASHAKFLQHLYRGYSRLRPSGWVRGGLHGAPMPYRPVTIFRCRGGMCLAGPERFAEMRGRSAAVIEWYSLYVEIYRVMAGRPPRSYHPFAAAGADAEGVARMGGQPRGSDLCDQPAFRAWFGDDAFEVGDASVLSEFMRRVESWDPVFISSSPPCQAYSTTDIQHLSDAPRLISLIRDHLRATGRLYAIENVKGAASDLLESAQLLYGAFFGLGVDRPRFFETSFELVIDEHIRVPGLALRRDTCLGPTRRWRRLDPFGRPELSGCCEGNIIPVQGKAPVGCTLEGSALAMGIDPAHMPYERLAQAIPPVYEQLVFAQACMAACRRDYGVPTITFDEMMLDPDTARATLRFWLRGAGDPAPDAGLALQPARTAAGPHRPSRRPAPQCLDQQVAALEAPPRQSTGMVPSG